MEQQSWVTMWEAWRKMMGAPSSATRRAIDGKLETRPCMLYWGDSWFSTPLYLNLARQSMRRIDGIGMLTGKPGARAERLFSRPQVRNTIGRLKTWPFDIVCVSAGGNDALSGQLKDAFKPHVARGRKGTMTAETAYDIFLRAGVFDRIVAAYRVLLDSIGELRQQEGKSHLRVVGHAYCKITRIGAKANLTLANIGLVAWLKGETGPWFWNVMRQVVTDEQEGKRFADWMIEDFKTEVVGRLTDAYGAFFSASDFHDIPATRLDDFWFDEIHPTEQGFAELATHFNRDIRAALPAEKANAVA